MLSVAREEIRRLMTLVSASLVKIIGELMPPPKKKTKQKKNKKKQKKHYSR